MNWTDYILKAAPEIALFAALALGHALGRLKLGSFSLGDVAGAPRGGQTVAPGLNAVYETTDSTTPVPGFAALYAISNVLLAVWGPVVVAFT